MTSLSASAREEWIATGPDRDQGYRVFALTLLLRPARESFDSEWLLEARIALAHPDQRCRIAWSHAPQLGLDLEPHYATGADGNRFLPGTGFDTVVAQGGPDAEAEAFVRAARAGPALRAWLGAIFEALDAVEGDPARCTWPPPGEGLAGAACRIEPNAIAAAWRKHAARRDEAAAAERRARFERDADPIYMPHNIG